MNPQDDIDATFVNAVRSVLEPRGLWGEVRVLQNGVISAGSVVVDLNHRNVSISTPKDKQAPETVEMAIALADAVGGVT